ncbi:hypothetical protein J0H58_15030 [bacterium]|nr:hypothetical protein [bacterium]
MNSEPVAATRLDPPPAVRVAVVAAPERREGFLRRNRTPVTFAVLLVVTDATVGRFATVWDRHSPDDYAARVIACAREPRDLVFVGGSPLAEGIAPDRVAGVVRGGRELKSVYAVGLSGATTSDVYHAVLRACPAPPRVLVYGLTATDLNDARHEPHGPHSLMTWGDLAGWVRLRPESAEWVTRHFVQGRAGRVSNLFHYRHGIRMWAACEAEAVLPGSSPETVREADELRERAELLRTGSGYAPARGIAAGRYDAAKAAGFAPPGFPFLEKYRTGSHLKYLHKLIDWCAAGGTELILLDVPVTADLEARYAAAFAEYRGRLADLERDRGVRVMRVTRETAGLTDAAFGDVIHLNRAGAARLSDRVRTELAR